MAPTLLLLLGTLSAIWLWLDGARARELATAVVDELCRRRDYQLLDGTVALNSARLVWGSQGIRIQRQFRYAYSIEGVGREEGQITLRGATVVRVQIREPEAPTVDANQAGNLQTPPDDNVIPFRPGRRD